MSARGEQRRELLVAAAARLLGEEGPAALSARAVAAAAGVPLAAVSYYFGSVDDLVRAGADRLYDGYRRDAEALVDRALSDGPPGDAAARALVVRVWLDPAADGPRPGRVRSLLTALASASDVPALAPRLRRYDADLQRLVVRVLSACGRDGTRARVLLAGLDGAALARLAGVPLATDAGGADGPAVPDPAPGPGTGAPLDAAGLLAGLVEDLALVWDDLAPAQNSRAVGSSRPDRPT